MRAPSGPMGIHENAKDAGCYTFIEERFFIDDVIDPAIVRDIRVFDPQYVPLLVKKVYMSPAGSLIHRQYHVVGRCIENPTEGYVDSAVKLELVPTGFKFDPTKIHALRTLQGKWPGPGDEGPDSPPSQEWVVNMPPPEVRVDRWLVGQLAAVQKFFDVGIELTSEDRSLAQTGTVTSTMDRLNQILNAEEIRDEAIQREAMTEARYRMRHNWKQFKEAADNGRWAPEPPDAAPKPFVDLGNRR